MTQFFFIKNSKLLAKQGYFDHTYSSMELLGIDNVFFYVGDLDKAIGYYEKMGFILKFRIPQIPAALFQIGQEVPGLILCASPENKPSKLWIEVEDAGQIKNELHHGTLLETTTGLTFEITDPWGNIIGFADYTKKPALSRKK